MARSCSSCGAEVSANARFCPSCGAPLWITCPACGVEQAAEAAFCSSCGASLRPGARRSADLPQHEERRVVTVLFADPGTILVGERVERCDLHRLVAEWISGFVPDRHAETAEMIAYHYEQALRYCGRDEDLERRSFDALLAAGDAAVRRGAYSSGEGLFGRALVLAPTNLERARARQPHVVVRPRCSTLWAA